MNFQLPALPCLAAWGGKRLTAHCKKGWRMDEIVWFYGLLLCALQHAVWDSKDSRRQDKQVETYRSEVTMWQHSEKALSWMGANTVLVSVARVSDFNLQKYWVHVTRLPKLLRKHRSQSLHCCSIMKMQSCFSQLLRELEMTSSSPTVLLLDSTLKCILQHTLWGFYWFIYCAYVQISHTCAMW